MLARVDKAWKGKYFPWVPEGGRVNSMLKNAKDKSDEKKHRVQWHLSGLAGWKRLGVNGKNRKSAQLDKQLGYIQEKLDRVSTLSAQTLPERATSEYLCESERTIEWVVFLRLFQEVALTRNLRPIEDATESSEGVTKEKEECCQRT